MKFGEMVRKRRAKAGWTQTELAGHIGCTATHISTIEAGKRGASFDLAKRLETVLQFKAGNLLAVWRRDKGIEDMSAVPKRPGPFKEIPIENEDDRLVAVPADTRLSYAAFGYGIQNNDMAPEIAKGDVVIVDKLQNVESGQFVLVRRSKDPESECTVRRFIHTGAARVLEAFNRAILPEHLKVEDKDRIEGVVLAVHRYYPSSIRVKSG